MSRAAVTCLPAIAAALFAVSACGSGSRGTTPGRPSCEAAWNAPDNEANRELVVTSGGATWKVEVTRWSVVPQAPPVSDPRAADLRIEGCSYMFFTSERWLSIGGTWEDGSLRWDDRIAQGARTPEQRRFEPTATVVRDGTIG